MIEKVHLRLLPQHRAWKVTDSRWLQPTGRGIGISVGQKDKPGCCILDWSETRLISNELK